MRYMINVDLEAVNTANGVGGTDCKSSVHEAYGPHYDLTVHVLECSARNARSVHRPPTRYWDDNGGRGYAMDEVLLRLRDIQLTAKNAYPRRCRRCVAANPPHWD